MLIDSHAHIQGAEYAEDREAVIARAAEAGVAKIVAVGGAGDMSSNTAAITLAGEFAHIYASVGMHPHDAKDVGEEAFSELGELARRPKVVAIGETGLDYHYDHSPRALQRRVFSRFIALARETRLPLIVHEREAASDAVGLLRSEGGGELRGVIHCFTGDYPGAAMYLDLGFYLSFTGIITFKNAASLREVVRKVPLERMLVETDAPYLTPVPYRGRRNEPAYVRWVAEMIAKIKGIDFTRVAEVTTHNAQVLFKL
jgi:TatD DNase family protein